MSAARFGRGENRTRPLRSDRASKQHRFWSRLLLLLGAVAGLWLVHGPLLRGAADLLVVDEPADHAQYVCLSSWEFGPDGDRAYDVAATLFRQNPACHILLIGSGPSRLVESGALASFETISRRELAARGLPQKAIESISRDGWDDWATARACGRGCSIDPPRWWSCSSGVCEALTSAACSVPCSTRPRPLACGCVGCATGTSTKPIGG